MFAERLQRIRGEMRERQLPAMLITDPVNRYYLSGFRGSAGALLITSQVAFLLTDFRYIESASAQAPDYEVLKVDGNIAKMLPGLLERTGADRFGFESIHVTYATYQEWAKEVPEAALVPARAVVEKMRSVKTQEEIALIREAVRIADGAYEHLKQFIRPGMTEKEVAWELEVWMRTHGGEDIAFDNIVASGPNGAMPHAVPSDRAIQRGEPIVVDMGARVRGYHSDLTRTFCLAEGDDTFHSIYDIVLQAQEAAEKGLQPGMQASDGDALARDVIAAAGRGEQFGHSLGHGVGLAVHELPRLAATSEDVLEPGQVVTVEPGIYIPGWGGVRIEDMVLVTESGAEVLTQAPKEPVVQVRE